VRRGVFSRSRGHFPEDESHGVNVGLFEGVEVVGTLIAGQYFRSQISIKGQWLSMIKARVLSLT